MQCKESHHSLNSLKLTVTIKEGKPRGSGFWKLQGLLQATLQVYNPLFHPRKPAYPLRLVINLESEVPKNINLFICLNAKEEFTQIKG